jgi:hypothetical protein
MSEQFYAATCCQDANCLKCAVSRDEIEQETVDFLTIMLDGKSHSGNMRVIAAQGCFLRFEPVSELTKAA